MFAVLFTLLTPLSLAYPASFAIGGLEGIGLNRTIAFYVYAFTHNPNPFVF